MSRAPKSRVIFILFFLFHNLIASCKNPSQARSSSYSEIGNDQNNRTGNLSTNPSGNSSDDQGQPNGALSENSKVTNCSSAVLSTMQPMKANDCYYFRKQPIKGSADLLGGKCIEKTETLWVGKKVAEVTANQNPSATLKGSGGGSFFTVCYNNLLGYVHEDAFKKK